MDMRIIVAAALAYAAVGHASAQSAQNASNASGQTSVAVGAIGESGLRATSGAVAVPLGAGALASGAVGVGLGASGQTELAAGFSGAATATSADARKLVEFSNAPLVIGDDVVVAKPQPAPQVPFTPAAQ
jgi:hypothetical protein